MEYKDDLFHSSVRRDERCAAAFERDADTAYFYLFDHHGPDGWRIIRAIHMFSGATDLTGDEIEIRWSDSGAVGLFIRRELWAAFAEEERFGGSYSPAASPSVPSEIVALFEVDRTGERPAS